MSRPRLPSRTRLVSCGVGAQLAVERVGDATFQGAYRFLLRLAGREFAVVERAAGRVAVTDLRDRGDVDRMVQLAIAA